MSKEPLHDLDVSACADRQRGQHAIPHMLAPQGNSLTEP
ncbi:Uncharacterised protein [Mycobacterium tuberculosis]|nr:Uncharacterised protein [Mycobacterium tuberculosis]